MKQNKVPKNEYIRKPVGKTNPYKHDVDYVSRMGYRDDSPFNDRPYIDIHTPSGMIDMSNTGIPLIANGMYLPPYSGTYNMGTPYVREQKISMAQDGRIKTPEGWEKEIRAVEKRIGDPKKWSQENYQELQDKLNEYKAWRENTPEGRAVVDYHNEPNEYVVFPPAHLNKEKYNMKRALELGYQPDERGHWPSVDYESGEYLKSKKHPTAWMEYLYGYTLNPEQAANYNVRVNPEGYFGDDQLQYIPKQAYGGDPSLPNIEGHYPFGGIYTKTHTHMKKGGPKKDRRKIPQSGVVIDKRTNQAYYFGDKGETGSFPVLTGKNPELNSNTYSPQFLNNNPDYKNTPVGYYIMEEGLPKTSFTNTHYSGRLRPIQPISAFGVNAPESDDLSIHSTFNDPKDPSVFKTRNSLYSAPGNKRYISQGCINCQKESYDAFNQAIPTDDTMMVIDSKNPLDLVLLNQAKARMTKKPVKKEGGWLDQYQTKGEVKPAEDGWLSNTLNTIYAKLNPYNWGVPDYSGGDKVGKWPWSLANHIARVRGDKEFMHNNKRYAVKDKRKKENWEVAEEKNPEFFKNYAKNYLKSVHPEDYEKRYKDLLSTHYRYGNPYVTIEKPGLGVSGNYGRAYFNDDENQMHIYGLKQNPNITKIDTVSLMNDYVQELLHARQLKDLGYEGFSKHTDEDLKRNNVYYEPSTKKWVNYDETMYTDPKSIEGVHMTQGNNLWDRLLMREYPLEEDPDFNNTRKFFLEKYKDKKFHPYEDQYMLRTLQRALSEAGYDMSESLKKDGTYDGIYGEQTKNALYNWQKGYTPTPVKKSNVTISAAPTYNKKYGGWLDKYQGDISGSQVMPSETTQSFIPANLKNKLDQLKKQDPKYKQKLAQEKKFYADVAKAEEDARKKEIADRKARIANSIKAQDEKIIGNPNWREVLARQTQATGDKLRISDEPNFFDDYVNPAAMIGSMATGLGQAPYQAQKQDSYMPYLTGIGMPLAMGALAGLGAKSTGQFINNIVNPLAGLEQSLLNRGKGVISKKPGVLTTQQELAMMNADDLPSGVSTPAQGSQLPPPPSEIIISPSGESRTVWQQIPIPDDPPMPSLANINPGTYSTMRNRLIQRMERPRNYSSRQENISTRLAQGEEYVNLADDYANMMAGRPAQHYPHMDLAQNRLRQNELFEERNRLLNEITTGDPDLSSFVSRTVLEPAPQEVKTKIKNISGLTQEDALAIAAGKDKDKIAKMSETEFKNTVLNPNGEIITYKKGPEVNNITYDMNTGRMVLRDQNIIPNQDFVDLYNSNIARQNEIIASKNKSGVQYRVKDLKRIGSSDMGYLTFETPEQIIPRQRTEAAIDNYNAFQEHPEIWAEERAGLRQNENGTWQFNEEVGMDAYSTKEGAMKALSEAVEDQLGPMQKISGESVWAVDLYPGKWQGNVEDIANQEYYKSIPGLGMHNTMATAFADKTARRGSKTYEAINDYLKEMGMGRVKPGFNSQTEYSLPAWEDFVKKGKAFGYYGNPKTVYGSMKSMLPYLGLGYLGYEGLQDDGYRRGGSLYTPPNLKKKTKSKGTSKNIQSSINSLFARNFDLYGSSNKAMYNPNSKYKFGGGWLDNLD